MAFMSWAIYVLQWLLQIEASMKVFANLKSNLSTECALKLERTKLELLVIVN